MARKTRTFPALLLALAAALPGCEAPRAAREAPRVDRGPAPDPARDPLGARLHRAVVERAGESEEVGTIVRGRMDVGHSADQGVLLYGGYCYSIFVEAEPSAGELQLRLVDTNGDPIVVDREHGASATLGLADPLCPERPAEYHLQISSTRGGAFAMRTFRAPAM
ncbi:MAG: hypothetical protein U0230_24640 [Polyangiales bacterium]